MQNFLALPADFFHRASATKKHFDGTPETLSNWLRQGQFSSFPFLLLIAAINVQAVKKNDTESEERSHHFSAVINRTVTEGVHFSKHLGNPKIPDRLIFSIEQKKAIIFPLNKNYFLFALDIVEDVTHCLGKNNGYKVIEMNQESSSDSKELRL